MDKPKDLIGSLIGKGEEYGKTTLELIKLKAVDKSSDITSSLVSWVVIVIFALLFFTLVNIGVALWLGDLLGQSYLGFFVVSGFYGLLTLIFILFRKQLLKKPVNNSIVKQILD